VTPEQLVALAQRERARLVVSSYNEPLITAEWAVAVFAEARKAGLLCAFVSNGNGTPEAIDHLAPWVDAYKIDLKGFDDRHYRTLGGTLGPVLETIQDLHRRGIWIEIVTLLIPGFNDSDDEIRRLTAFVASVSTDIPWHVTAFHSDYKMQDTPDTGADSLIRAAEIGREAGLRYVYAGNRPGQVGGLENTYCPGCSVPLIERVGYLVRGYRITSDGRCPECAVAIPGRWPTTPETVRIGPEGAVRLPRRV
jgi:pyruvate formate lyase activating enzyme